MKEKLEKISNKNMLKILFVVTSILFIVPSIQYFIKHKTVYNFNQWFKFLLNDSNRMNQTLLYILILFVITFIYISIIKNRNKIFKTFTDMIKYISIIGLIYVFTIPFTCSDVFYYLGVGRIDSTYNQNPYYTTIKEYVDTGENSKYLEQDTVLSQGYINDWADTTVVYGPVWQLVCKAVSLLSFGNIDIGLLIFKLINLLIHIINCYLIYKITGKKIFSLIYGLNPFVLIEGIVCVHNDIFIILFTLLSLFFMLKKKNLVISMIFLACATGIKYFSILLLPFIIIYYFRKEKPSVRLINCIKYGMIFAIALLIPYLLYVRDISILNGMATQQNKVAKSIYVLISEYFSNDISIANLSSMLLRIFVIIYFFTCVMLLFKNKITFREMMQKYTLFLLVFLFVLITQFQPWYLMWLVPVMMWQKSNNLKVITLIGIVAEFANSVFLLNGEGWRNGTPFIFFMVLGILAIVLYNTRIQKREKG